jgi:T5SS/PEP-CTERM-associated repeat protein
MHIGRYGDGRLTIENGGKVSGRSQVGMFAGATGLAIVRGTESSWTLSGQNIGGIGTGTVIVEEGATLVTSSSNIGGGGHGELYIRGDGSTWTESFGLFLGYNGTGMVSVADGGAASFNGDVFLGGWEDEGSGTGHFTVTGSNSTCEVGALFWAGSGDFGTGTMQVDEGGRLSTIDGWIGVVPGSTGLVSVSGAGSQWENQGELVVGVEGMGDLVLEDGAVVVSGDGWIGLEPESEGTIIVRGAGAAWTNGGEVFIGSFGRGRLRVDEGGSVSNIGTWIGTSPGSTGEATVGGADSTWFSDGQFIVGYRSVGSLSVSNQAQVIATGNGIIGFVQTHEFVSEVTVADEGSRWSLGGELTVGSSAKGAMTILAGGQVQSLDGFIGRNAGSEGAVVLAGHGSEWLVRGDLSVGEGDTGTLRIQQGARVMVSGVTGVEAGGLVGGDGLIGGDLSNRGVVAPDASVEALEVSGDYVQHENGTLRIELLSSARFARLFVNGGLSLDGALEVTLGTGFIPCAGTEFRILNWTGTQDGEFSQLALACPVAWDTSRLYTEGVIVAGNPSADCNGEFDTPASTCLTPHLAQGSAGEPAQLEFSYLRWSGGVGTTGVDYEAHGWIHRLEYTPSIPASIWMYGRDIVEQVGLPVDHGNGTETVRVRIVPFERSPRGYVRLRFLRSR